MTFALINHQTSEAKRRFKKQYVREDDPEYMPVRLRTFTHSITFFELTRSGELEPVMTTVLDDYLSGTEKYIAIRFQVATVTAGRTLGIQELGTCVPGK